MSWYRLRQKVFTRRASRIILALVAVRDLDVIQFDITSAYLRGTLKEEVNME